MLSPEAAETSHGGGALTISFEHRRWVVRTARPGAELLLDGIPCRSATLQAGSLLGIRGLRLVAESARTIALAGYLSRLLGWSRDAWTTVDETLQQLRTAQREGAPLLLKAEGQLACLIRGLHEHTVGPGAPLVECRQAGYHKRTRHGVAGVVAKPAGLTAYQAAQHGTLFLHEDDLPGDFVNLLEECRQRAGSVQLIIGADLHRSTRQAPATLTVPPLSARKAERDLIIIEYLEEAAAELGLERSAWGLKDLDWVSQFSSRTHADIHEGAQHVLAIAVSSSMEEAAHLLATDVASLEKWLATRLETNPGIEHRRAHLECRSGRGLS